MLIHGAGLHVLSLIQFRQRRIQSLILVEQRRICRSDIVHRVEPKYYTVLPSQLDLHESVYHTMMNSQVSIAYQWSATVLSKHRRCLVINSFEARLDYLTVVYTLYSGVQFHAIEILTWRAREERGGKRSSSTDLLMINSLKMSVKPVPRW